LPKEIQQQAPIATAYSRAVEREQEILKFELSQKQLAERAAMTDLQKEKQSMRDKNIAIKELYGNEPGIVPTIKQIQEAFYNKEKRALSAADAADIQDDIKKGYEADTKKLETLEKQAEKLKKERGLIEIDLVNQQKLIKQAEETMKASDILIKKQKEDIDQSKQEIDKQKKELEIAKQETELFEQQRAIAKQKLEITEKSLMKEQYKKLLFDDFSWYIVNIIGDEKPISQGMGHTTKEQMMTKYNLLNDENFFIYSQNTKLFIKEHEKTNPSSSEEYEESEEPVKIESKPLKPSANPDEPDPKPKKTPEPEPEIEGPVLQFGEGKGGITNVEINKIMKPFKSYVGCYALDQLKDVPIKNKMCFIMNTRPIRIYDGHWVACWIDTNKDKSVEFMDPFGQQPPKEYTKEIKNIINKINPDDYLKYKINRNVQQDKMSENCGWISIRFLLDRLNGDSFKKSTGYSVATSEKRAEMLKKKFEYI
jgi:hypothetical protein